MQTRRQYSVQNFHLQLLVKWPRFDKIGTYNSTQRTLGLIFIYALSSLIALKFYWTAHKHGTWQELRHGPNILVTVLLVIAGDVEQNPGPSASSSMGSVNNLYTGFRRESSVTDVTGGITPTALARLWVASYSMSFSVYLHPPESSANWERTQPSLGNVPRMETRRQYYTEYFTFTSYELGKGWYVQLCQRPLDLIFIYVL